MKKIKKLTTTLLFFTALLFGQSQEQINQAKRIIEQSGMSESDVRAEAKKRGYSDSQINAALKSSQKGNIPKELNNGSTSKNETKSGTIENASEGINDEETIIVIDEPQNAKKEVKRESHNQSLRYFGYEIFKQDPKLFQSASVGALDPNYLIGPGDEIIIMLWGETQFREVLGVNREGFVFIPEVGQIFVNGLNLSLLESKLFRVLSQSYSSLDPMNQKATTFLDVSLGKLRPLRIQVLGEVAQPGVYTISPSASLFSALYYFNGPTTQGSLREIKLIRGNKEIVNIDFYNYLLTGKKLKDEKLLLDDVIFVPKRMKSISIDGEVNRPGIYELKQGEGLKDLLTIAGGLKITAYVDNAQINRIIPFKERESLDIDRKIIDINLNEVINNENNIILQDGDKINIFSIMKDPQNTVAISGAVSRPGIYDIGDSLSLRELILKADSLLGDTYLDRADIIRTKDDLTKELIKVNLDSAMANMKESNIDLSNSDEVVIYRKSEMIEESYVSIKGYVKNPGRYKKIDNMTIHDLIFFADGYNDTTFLNNAYLDRADLTRFQDDRITRYLIPFNLGEILKNKEHKTNILLEPDDEITLYSKSLFTDSKTVSISGEIKKSGSFNYKTNMTLKDLIIESGGFKNENSIFKIDVARLNPKNMDRESLSKIFSFDFDSEKFKNFNNIDEFLLEPYDHISVRPNPYYFSHKKVTITGEVYYPGDYAIRNENEKLSDIIKRSGGVRKNAYLFGSSFVRAGKTINMSLEKVVKNPKDKDNIIVQDGDKIIIRKNPNMINVIGEVNAPGNYTYDKKYKIRDILKLAGGLTPNANKKDIYITLPNGFSRKYSPIIGNHKIKDGSVIIIGKKPEEEPFDRTEYAKELSTIFANFAQAISILLIAQAGNN